MCRVEELMGLGLQNAEMMKCARTYKQLAEWLKELKQFKEQEPCEDVISRQTAIELIKNYCENGCDIVEDNWCPSCQREQFIELLKAMPSVIPKGVTVTDFADKCRECGREKVLDKIRAEIIKLQTYKMFEGEDTVYVERDDVLEILDKYRTESEE